VIAVDRGRSARQCSAAGTDVGALDGVERRLQP
jgi:hypothetical protein